MSYKLSHSEESWSCSQVQGIGHFVVLDGTTGIMRTELHVGDE